MAAAVALLPTIGVTDVLGMPTAQSVSAQDIAPQRDFYPESSGLNAAPPLHSTNVCISFLEQARSSNTLAQSAAQAMYQAYNCSAAVISRNTIPASLTPERVISRVVGNCEPYEVTESTKTMNAGISQVQYVESATTTGTSRTHGFSAGITVTNGWKAGVLGGKEFSVALTAETSHSWGFTESETKALQTGHWQNSGLSMKLPPYSWNYFGFKDRTDVVDVLWQWTPDPKKPEQSTSAIQTLNFHEWLGQGGNDQLTQEQLQGRDQEHTIPMTPAEIKNCWDNAGWQPGVPRLTYLANTSRLESPIIRQPDLLAPDGTIALDSYPFMFSTYPKGNPITRNVAKVNPISQKPDTPQSLERFVIPETVSMWGRTPGRAGLTRVDTAHSIVMPPGSEAGFWTGGVCNTFTATIGGSSGIERSYEQKFTVFAVEVIDGDPQYTELKEFVVPSSGSPAGEAADGKVSVTIPPNTEAIAIRAFRPDRIEQDLTNTWLFSGNRNTVVVADPEVTCHNEEPPGDRYIRSAYQGEITDVTANLAATPAQVAADSYLNLRPNATPSDGWGGCSTTRPDYVGYSCNGTPTKSDGTTYAAAIGLHAPTAVTWGLTPPTCHAFTFGVAFDDNVKGRTERNDVNVGVYVDNVLQKTVRLGPDERNWVVKVEQPLKDGPHNIKLELNMANGAPNWASHVNIIEPKLSCQIQDPKVSFGWTTPPRPRTMEYLSVNALTWSNEVAWEKPATHNIHPYTNGPIIMNGFTQPVAIGAHAVSSIDVRIPRDDCQVFSAQVGALDLPNDWVGSVQFEVWGGGKKIAASRIIKTGESAVILEAPIVGLKYITLKVGNGGDNNTHDYAGWANPVIGCLAAVDPTQDPNTPIEQVDPPTTPTPPNQVTMSAAAVQWAQNTYSYRPALRDVNLDTGKTVTIEDGRAFDRAIAQVSGPNGGSIVRLALAQQCTKFTAVVGIDDYAALDGRGSLQFALVSDGITAYETPILRGRDKSVAVSVNLNGVQSLELHVKDGGDGKDWDHGVWGNPTLTCDEGADILTALTKEGVRYLSEMPWLSNETSAGISPARRDKAYDVDGPVRLEDRVFERGIGMAPWTRVRITLGGQCKLLEFNYGIDDSSGNQGSARFEVWGDHKGIWTSGVVTGSGPTYATSVNVTGVQMLELIVVDGGDGNFWDRTSWGDPRVTCVG